MMQNVAAEKSQIAAFATVAPTHSLSKTEPIEPFSTLMQEQKTLHCAVRVPEGPPPHSRRKEALQQSLDEIDNVPSSKVAEDTKTQPKTTSTKQTETSSSPHDKSALQSTSEPQVSDTDKSEPERLQGHAETTDEGVSECAAHTLSDEVEVGTGEPGTDVAQQWVALIDNLQKLADVQPTKPPLVDLDVQSNDVSETELKSDKLNITKDENSLPLVKNPNAEHSISILVDDVLHKVLTDPELTNSQLTELDIREKVAELLLKKPEVLQNLLTKLQNTNKEDSSGKAESNNSTTTIDSDSLRTSQNIETAGKLDFTKAENKDLLRALLVDSDIATNPLQETVKSTTPRSDTPQRLVQTQAIETPVGKIEAKLELVSEQGELLEQHIQVEPSSLLGSSKVDKISANSANKDIKNILNLTDNQQHKVLENIAQRVLDSIKSAEPISPEPVIQQVVMPKVTEIMSSVESPSKDLIAALKSGLTEFKEQLSQGREPGIDLKALVSEALEKTTGSGAATKAPANLEQVVNRVSQMLEFAQTMNRAIEHHHDQAYNATVRDVAQIQGEQTKQIHLNQFEKSMNLSKPEGHQQLAEKVRWMVNTKNLVAEIRLDPAELGSVHVKVAMSGESATVTFVVQSQQARDAVDTATPRLKEMLAEKGIELGESSVRQESDAQQSQEDGELAKQGDSSQYETDDGESPEQLLAQQKIVNGAIGGIDYFV